VSRKRQTPTHFERAFDATRKLLEAEAKLADAAPGRRGRLNKKVGGETAKLERLTERDRETTKLLAEYLRQHGGLTNIADFIRWSKKQRKLTMIEERAVRTRLQKEYGARGEPGRKPNKH
jgi:hypothetical protein